jgi:hypothetical protein
MASSFYVRVSGEQRGPISVSALKTLAASGELALTDLVSRDGREWCKASDVKGLEFPPSHPKLGQNVDELSGAEFDPLELMGAPPIANSMPAPPLPETLRPVSQRSPLNLVGCADCSELVSIRAMSCPHCGCPIRQPATQSTVKGERRYQMIRAIAIGYFIMGALGLAATSVGVLAFANSMSESRPEDAYSSLSLILGSLAFAVTSFAISQLIELVLQVEENTRLAGQVLAERL